VEQNIPCVDAFEFRTLRASNGASFRCVAIFMRKRERSAKLFGDVTREFVAAFEHSAMKDVALKESG